ncbi:hypothetical protein SUGI_0570700 [Cryptomeria japonica]|uniref:uncharacterized protein LOC131079555 n=1 Tax=Cryptomeria japonica TaxID=3369 RepID=UPI0024089FC3|nr:uncharacterized protein LOC131079555 [Cryptomeria japonica]GLJ28934.1 hypothetical protein SUGI_0570700 [Cryptomeria japonica]
MEESTSSGSSKKKQKKERDKTTQRQISQGPELQSTDITTGNFDLIPEFPNEVTLGPLMASMRWYMKPLLMTLSRAWAEALRNSQYTTSQYQPYALKNSVILYAHTPRMGNDNTLTLHIYQDGILRRLPLPSGIDGELVRFFLSDQCIYALTPHYVDQEYMYKINKLDLGGGMFKWQSLTPLPNIGERISISSVISEDGDSTHDYLWIQSNEIDIEEIIYSKTGQRVILDDGNDWSTWKLHTTTRDGQCKYIPPHLTPAQPVENSGNHPPQYLDISSIDRLRPRHLYKLFTAYEYSLKLKDLDIIKPTVEPEFLLVFKDDHSECGIRGVHCIRNKVKTDGNIKFLLYKKDLQNAERLEGKELAEVFKSWRNFLSNWRLSLPEHISAVKFTADLSHRMDGWQRQLSLPSSNKNGFILNKQSTIKLAQQGTIYIYAYIATICTNMYLQGGPNINILTS